MKRKSSKAWIIAAVIVAMLVLVFAMVGCKPKPDGGDKKPEAVDTAAALGKVIDAADATLGKIKNSNDTISLGLTVGVKGENLKLNIDEKDVKVNFNDVNFDVKVKLGANLSKTTDNNEILAEIMSGNAVKLGVYSKKDVVYVQDGFTTTSTKKFRISGAEAVGYNQYIDDLPGILQNALKNLDLSSLGGMIGNFKSLINGLITTTTTTDGYSFDIVFVSSDPNAGLAPILKQLGSSLKFGEPFDGLIATYLPYILGGNFDDFSNGTVTTTSKITLDVGVKDNMLTGLKINVDLDPLKSIKDVGGKISIEIGNLVIDNKKTDVLPSDIDSAYTEEGALTANLALDVPNNPKGGKGGLQLMAKIEFSPSLKDEDLKVHVVAMDKDGKEIDLEGGYVNFGTEKNPDYAIVFDMKGLYDIAKIPAAERPANTKYKYSLTIDGENKGLGSFLTNLITSQRVFVFFDEDNQDWTDSYYKAEFFKKNSETFTAKDLTDITPKVQAYYVAEFGGVAADYAVEYRFADGTLALDSTGKGDFTKRKAELGYNLNITAIVSLVNKEHGSTYNREYVEVTYSNGTASENKKVRVHTGTVNLEEFAPAYVAAEGTVFDGWKIGSEEEKLDNLGAVNITEDVTVRFTTKDVSQKQKVVFKRYDMDNAKYDEDAYATRYFDKWNPNGVDNKAKNGISVVAEDLPAVPYISGMEGKWVVISDQGFRTAREYTPQIIDEKTDGNYSTVLDRGVATVYAVYELAEDADWTRSDAMLERRFTRKTLKDGEISSIVEAGDPSLVGKGAVNTIIGSLGEIFGIIREKKVDANFVAKIMGAISPYLGTNKLIADRILSIAVDYDVVQYPYELPTVKNGTAIVDADSVAKIDDAFLSSSRQSSDIVSGFGTRCQNAVIYATYMRFVGKYGYLNMEDTALVKELCWTAAQVNSYKNETDPEERAQIYVENEEASYDAKVAAKQAVFDKDKEEIEKMIIGYAEAILGKAALGGAETVEEFLFGADGKSPLVVAFDFAEPTDDSGYGVTIKLMRGKDTLASISGDVFFSYAKDIPEIKASDYATALSVHEMRKVADGEDEPEFSIVVEELIKIGMAMLEDEADDSGDNTTTGGDTTGGDTTGGDTTGGDTTGGSGADDSGADAE